MLGQTVFINEMGSTMLSFLGGDKGEVGSDEDFSEASEGHGNGRSNGGISESIVNHRE